MRKFNFIIFFIILCNILLADEGLLEVRTDISGVKVYLDGEYVGETWSFENINVLSITDRKSGVYLLKCTYEGYRDNEQDVFIPDEGTERIVVNFLQRDIKSAPLTKDVLGSLVIDTGFVIVRSRPTGASIFLNSKELLSKTDARVDSLVIGKYHIKCVFGNKRILEEDFTLVSEDTVKVMADFFENTIEIRARYSVSFATSPESAVYLDGKKLGIGTQTVKLEKGKYNLRFEKTGYHTLEKTIEINGEDLYIFELDKIQTGSLKISAPNSNIYISGKEIGYQEKTIDLVPGTYSVTAKREGYDDAIKSVKIVANEKKNINLNPERSIGEITINFIDSKDKVSIKAYNKIKQRMEKKDRLRKKEENIKKKEKKSISSTGNKVIDDFFENIDSTNKQLKMLSTKLNRIQSYLIMVVLEPELILQHSSNQEFQATLKFSHDYISKQNHSIVQVNDEVLNKLSGTSFIPLLANIKSLADEMSSLEKDINDIKDTILNLIQSSQQLPNEAKKLSPLKVPSVISNITKAAGQLQEMAKTTETIINIIPPTIMLANAIITKEETEIVFSNLNTDSSEIVSEKEPKSMETESDNIEISYVNNIRLLINSELTDFYSSKPFSMEVGEYELSINSDRYKLANNNQRFFLKKGKNPNKNFIVDDIFWLHEKADFWKKSKLISLSGTVIFSSLGVICNLLGDNAYNNYENSSNTSDAIKYRDQIETYDTLRDLSYQISIVPAVWLIVSWLNESKYNNKL